MTVRENRLGSRNRVTSDATRTAATDIEPECSRLGNQNVPRSSVVRRPIRAVSTPTVPSRRYATSRAEVSLNDLTQRWKFEAQLEVD